MRLYLLAVVVLAALALITTLAVSLQGEGIARCNSLSGQNRDVCVELLAVRTENWSMCGLVGSSYSDSCYMAIAQNTTNYGLCGRISSPSLSAQCFSNAAFSSGSPELCSMIPGLQGSNCLYEMAIETSNASACESIGSVPLRENCSATVNFNDAVKYTNPAFCANIPVGGGMNETYNLIGNANITAYGNLYLNITQFINYEAYSGQSVLPRDACYISLAFRSGDSSYCSDVQDSNLSASCNVLMGGQISAINSTANYTALINSCSEYQSGACNYTEPYLEALVTSNVSYCGEIPAPQSYQCYFAFASKYNQTSYCSFIKNATVNNDCVLTVEGDFSNSSSV